ncbi:hypothetical protein TWF730_011332 [Orbilia blumenaviensis]|uniref:Uncharacterized protein n=1 Tax=Orbilia blumenaviensis TaxID=1796055 RepID=A0AAV9UPJ2_9PEZI
MSLTYASTVTVTDGCAPVCADYVSCGQAYGGCFTSCPGVPAPTFTVPDYVLSACMALGSTTATTTESEYEDTVTVTPPVPTETATETATATDTISTIDTETGTITIETDTTSLTTIVSSSDTTTIPTNGTTTQLPNPTNTEPSGAERGVGAIKLGLLFGAFIAIAIAGGSPF